MSYTERRLLLSGAAALLLVWAILHLLSTSCSPEDAPPRRIRQPSAIVNDGNVHTYEHNGKVYTYGSDMPLIFIGGVPRSGTTLMRVMLDAHPDIRCGQETHVIPFILDMRSHWLRSQKESVRLQEAGVTEEVLNSAIAAFSLEIILGHGDPALRLCNKDPMTLRSAAYLAELFPHAKFIFMIRDGRATVHSIISRQVSIRGFSLSSYRQCLMDWNRTITFMYKQCLEVGSSRCLMVPYEQLVLHPRAWMEKILSYIDVPWNDFVLHHEDLVDMPGGVMLSSMEKSTDQVIKPVNLDALTKWVGHIPPDVVANMSRIAPMLSVLGYDPHANPPHYGYPDAAVAENTKLIHSQVLWGDETTDVSNPNQVHPYG